MTQQNIVAGVKRCGIHVDLWRQNNGDIPIMRMTLVDQKGGFVANEKIIVNADFVGMCQIVEAVQFYKEQIEKRAK